MKSKPVATFNLLRAKMIKPEGVSRAEAANQPFPDEGEELFDGDEEDLLPDDDVDTDSDAEESHPADECDDSVKMSELLDNDKPL